MSTFLPPQSFHATESQRRTPCPFRALCPQLSALSFPSPPPWPTDFIVNTVSAHPGRVTICSIGPMTNIAEAIRRSPDTMRRVGRLIIMASSYEGDGPSHAAKEHNSTADPAAMTYQYMDILARDFTYMHDPQAAAVAIDPTLVTTRRMSAHVTDDGRVSFRPDANGWLDICVDVDIHRFDAVLSNRITSLMPS